MDTITWKSRFSHVCELTSTCVSCKTSLCSDCGYAGPNNDNEGHYLVCLTCVANGSWKYLNPSTMSKETYTYELDSSKTQYGSSSASGRLGTVKSDRTTLFVYPSTPPVNYILNGEIIHGENVGYEFPGFGSTMCSEKRVVISNKAFQLYMDKETLIVIIRGTPV